MTRTGFGRTLTALVAVVCFAVAGVLLVSLSELWEGRQDSHTMASGDSGPPVGAAPAPVPAAPGVGGGPRSLSVPHAAKSVHHLDPRAAERERAVRKPAADEGPLQHIRYWINKNLAFDGISDSTKRTLSLLFSAVGMVFTALRFFLTRRSHQMLAAHLVASASTGETRR